MPAITYFEQERRDGGIRTGIDLDGETVLSRFRPGKIESDPALVWYVDVRCEGSRLPRTPERAVRWLLQHERDISRAIDSLADELPAGIDPAAWPLRRTRSLGSGARITVTCSAVRREHAKRIASILRSISEHFRERIESLDEVEV